LPLLVFPVGDVRASFDLHLSFWGPGSVGSTLIVDPDPRGMFKALGAFIALYVICALTTGAVYARAGAWGRSYGRDTDPLGYWSAIGSYIVLVFALFFVF